MPISSPFKSIVTGTAAALAVSAALAISAAGTASASGYDDEELSYAIPLDYDVALDCVTVHDFDDWSGVRAGARCESYGNPAGEFVLFSSSADLYYRFDNVVGNTGTTCPNGQGASYWHDELDPEYSLGQIVCVVESDGSAGIAWTDERTMTLNYVASDSQTHDELFVWWQNTAV